MRKIMSEESIKSIDQKKLKRLIRKIISKENEQLSKTTIISRASMIETIKREIINEVDAKC